MCILHSPLQRSYIKTRKVKLTQDARKKKNNLENIRRNLVSNPSCRGQLVIVVILLFVQKYI